MPTYEPQSHIDDTWQETVNEAGARAVESMREELDALHHARECDTEQCQEGADSEDPDRWHDEDKARGRIEDTPLSVEVRSGWYFPGADRNAPPEEFRILLSTGGPASQIVGTLSEYGDVETARFQYQDWGTPWTYVEGSMVDENLQTFAGQFYYGEGG